MTRSCMHTCAQAVTHSLTHSLTHSCTAHTCTHSLTHVLHTQALTHSTSISAISLLGEGIHMLIGPETTAGTKATYPILSTLQIPQITTMATDHVLSLTPLDYPSLIKVTMTRKIAVKDCTPLNYPPSISPLS